MVLAEALRTAREQRRAAVMGVLNATPDSFSDGGRYTEPDAARRRVGELVSEGADIIDVGGESTRPGAEPVEADEQIRRIAPALRAIAERGFCASVDTTLPEVAEYALTHGATIVNDVSCLADAALAEVVARHGAGLVLMHSRGPMSAMRGFSRYPEDGYDDVVRDVLAEWRAARDRAVEAGVPAEEIALDPGLGFAKSANHSLALMSRLGELSAAGAPIVVGPSRKSFLAAAAPAPAEQRLGGTVAACVLAQLRGAAAVRVHDVAEVRQALLVTAAITSERGRASAETGGST